MQISMTVNGDEVLHDVEPRVLLVHFIRDVLGLTGTHWGCDTSNCGTCVVLMDGEPVKSCTVLAVMAAGHDIRTVEGLADGPSSTGPARLHGRARPAMRFLHPGHAADRARAARQNPHPTATEIREAISGQICRCTVRDDRAIGPVGGRSRGRRGR